MHAWVTRNDGTESIVRVERDGEDNSTVRIFRAGRCVTVTEYSIIHLNGRRLTPHEAREVEKVHQTRLDSDYEERFDVSHG
jgi:hypothetical protein